MHPEHGLWHSYRFALVGDGFDPLPGHDGLDSPCLGCSDKPCLTTCPVNAFDGQAYDVDACAAYLVETPSAGCHASGCLARLACPVAPQLRYLPEQGAFHLRAFLHNRP